MSLGPKTKNRQLEIQRALRAWGEAVWLGRAAPAARQAAQQPEQGVGAEVKTVMTPLDGRSSRWWWTGSQWLLLLAIVVFLSQSGHLDGVLAALRQAELSAIGLALLLGGVMLIIRAAKWWGLLRRILPRLPFICAWQSLLGGMALGLLTPGRIGEVGRTAAFPPGTRLAVGGLLLVDRTADVAALAMVAGLGTAAVASPAWRDWPILAAFGAGGLALALPALVPTALRWQRLPEKVRDRLAALALALEALRRRDVALNLLASSLLMALDVVSLHVLACAFEPVNFAVVAFAFPWILLANLVPITPAGLGVREGAAVAILHAYGVQVATAINATLLLFVINSVIPALLGWRYLGRRVAYATHSTG
ncbi:MAG: lysylphosphatidylglycerol synthase transmembrane domain-containing protein [Acidobacteriota bacterium]